MNLNNMLRCCAAVIWSTLLAVGCIDISSDNKPLPTRNEPGVTRTNHENINVGKIIGSGNKKTEARKVSGFSEIVIENSGTLIITQTGTESLSIEADDNILPLLTSEVSGSRLVLGIKPNTSLSTNSSIKYNLTVKDLSIIENTGSAGIIAKNINTPKLAVVLSGSGDLKISGKADRQNLSIKGSGSYKAFELISKVADVIIKGSGDAFVDVSNSLDVKISGSGSVKYEGGATVSKKITGSGSVQRR
jgi:hypothetical protein